MTVLLVTGSRDGHSHVFAVLDRWVAKFGEPDVVVLGDATGVDALARSWAVRRGYLFEVLKADWRTYGPAAAGPRRNAAMVDFAKGSAWSYGAEAHCVAFPVGEAKGTRGCMALAMAAGLLAFEADVYGRVRAVASAATTARRTRPGPSEESRPRGRPGP